MQQLSLILFLKEDRSLVFSDYWHPHPPPGGTSLNWGLHFFGLFSVIIFWPALNHLWTWWNSVPCSPMFCLSRPENNIGASHMGSSDLQSHLLRQWFLAERGAVPSSHFGHFLLQGNQGAVCLREGRCLGRQDAERSARCGLSHRTETCPSSGCRQRPHWETLS